MEGGEGTFQIKSKGDKTKEKEKNRKYCERGKGQGKFLAKKPNNLRKSRIICSFPPGMRERIVSG